MELRQHLQAGLHNRARPMVDLVVLVRVSADGVLHSLLDDLADIVHDEKILEVPGQVNTIMLIGCLINTKIWTAYV